MSSNTGICVYVPGECDADGTARQLTDVVAMIALYRGDIQNTFECNCPPHGENFTPTGDPNGNCIPNELADVVWEIGAYSAMLLPPVARIVRGR